MKRITMPVPADVIASTIELNAFQRMNVLKAKGLIPDHLLYGYGVYGGAYIADDEHVSYMIGDSCD